jgi:exopolyphosphatase/guanosine-5'-triphosphate,3'-diphosphate pyrophosphatase
MLLLVWAVVDIGSNSVKILVAKMQQDVMEEIHLDAQSTSLAKDLSKNGRLNAASIEKTLQALKRFKAQTDALGISHIKILGTAAMREASNTSELSLKIEELFGVAPEIISGDKEAELAILGAMSARPPSVAEQDCAFADMGGASTEVGFSLPTTKLISTSLGALKTHTQLNLTENKISDSLWETSKKRIQEVLHAEIPQDFRQELSQKKHFIAVGGTILMATQVLGLPKLGSSTYALKRDNLEDFANKIRKMDFEERYHIPLLGKDRADILPLGILLLTEMMRFFNLQEGFSTVCGLRHGYILQKHREVKKT